MKRKFLALAMVLLVIISAAGSVMAQSGGTPSDAHLLNAPTENMNLCFWLDADGTPYYSVIKNETVLIQPSKLGLNLSIGNLQSGFSLTLVEAASGNNSWNPIAGDKETIYDIYNEKTYSLIHGESGLSLKIQMRAYDTGVALRYLLPQGTYTVNGEYTTYTFPEGVIAEMHEGSDRLYQFGISEEPVYTHLHTNATVPVRVNASEFGYNDMYYAPSTFLYPNGMAVTLCEGNLDNYVRMRTSGDTQANTLRTVYYRELENGSSSDPNANAGGFAEVRDSDPAATPWRVLVVGDEVKNLPENSDIVQNLNEQADENTYKFSEWVRPGDVLRVGNNTSDVKNKIDEAAQYGYQYVHLDTGWFGAEFDRGADPRLDPSLLEEDDIFRQWIIGDGQFVHTTGFDTYKDTSTPGGSRPNVNIPEMCAYAKERGVGVILYFNAEIYARAETNERGITYEDIFERFEHWGVSGAKPGFAPYGTQANEKLMADLIESAARHKLVLTIHDEYIRTGTERTFPNCLTTEAIYGDEAIGRYTPSKQIEEDITTLFTRMIQGPADHTFCYPGKGTKAYALASPIMFKSGLHYLYWYAGSAAGVSQKDNVSVWYNLPAEWDELKVLEASLREYATYARRSGDTWYIGSLSAIDRQLNISLDFLESGKTYTAEIWADEIGADAYAEGGISDITATAKMQQLLVYSKEIVTADTVLTRPLGYGNGYAVKIKEATPEEEAECPVYKTNAQELTYLLTEASKYTNDGRYEQHVWDELVAAADVGRAVYAKENPTEQEIADAIAELQRTIGNLQDLSVLRNAINYAERMLEKNYSRAAWRNLNAAKTAAYAAIEADYKTETLINEAAAALNTAIEACNLKEGLAPDVSVWLDDLDWTAIDAYAGAGRKNMDYAGGDLQLKINGAVTDVRGVFAHSKEGGAYVTYNIEGKGYEFFEGYVGIDTDKIEMGDVIFKFYGDGNLIYETQSSLANFTDNAMWVRVPIAGVSELKLVADPNGEISGDWAVWGDAKLVSYKFVGAGNPDEVYYLSDLTETGSGNLHYGSVIKDKNVSENPLSVKINGEYKVFDKGLFLHTKADSAAYVTYDLSAIPGANAFQAYAACDGAKDGENGRDVIYRVYGDDDLLYESRSTAELDNEAQPISVKIAGYSTLKIEVDANGENRADWADLADAKILVQNNIIDPKYVEEFEYISNLKPVGQKLRSYYNDMSEPGLDSGRKLNVLVDGARREFDKGISTHAREGESYISYDISGLGYNVFSAYVACNYDKYMSMTPNPDYKWCDITFRVYGDGRLLYESVPSESIGNAAQKIAVDITGVSILKLEADSNGFQGADWGEWCDAKLMYCTKQEYDASVKNMKYENGILTAWVENNDIYSNPLETQIIAAVKDVDGRLTGIKSYKVDVAGSCYEPLRFVFESGVAAELYVFDSLNSIMPLGVKNEIRGNAPAEKDAYLFLMGDSLGQSYPYGAVYPNGNSGSSIQGWGYYYNNYFRDSVGIYNMAKSGWRTQFYLNYVTNLDNTGNDYDTTFHNISGKINEIKNFYPNAPVYIVMSLGTNDKEAADGTYKLIDDYENNIQMMLDGYTIVQDGAGYESITNEAAKTDERTMIKKVKGIKELGAELILVSPYTVDWCAPGNTMRAYHEEAKQAMANLAQKNENVKYADIWPLLEEHMYTELGAETAKTQYLVSDGLHFNAVGAEYVSQKHIEAIKTLDSGLTEYMVQ